MYVLVLYRQKNVLISVLCCVLVNSLKEEIQLERCATVAATFLANRPRDGMRAL